LDVTPGIKASCEANRTPIFSDGIIPESHRNGHERLATFRLMIGFAVMMLLDVLLG
jgi:zinc transporter ZupT